MNHSATYSPEDNKLRLYPVTRLDKDTYERVKKAGFIYAPKQELFVAPMWTPGREDFLIELCGEIEDEDKSLVDRAEERAERFSDYSDKREADAKRAHQAVHAITDNIPFGQPILVGHHSERRARKDAEKIENGMRKAVKMWETSKYWEDRAKGAIRHAKHKERPDVRARRIKGLEADKRKQERIKKDAERLLKLWTNPEKELTMDRAKGISNYDYISHCFSLADYPRNEPASQYEGSMSLWSALDGGVITPQQAKEIAVPAHERGIKYADRWINHLKNRLAYEKAMMNEAGGTAADNTKPEKGGACKCWASPRAGWSYIQKVNKVSVTVLDNWGNGGRNFTRNIPFDKLSHIMTARDVEAAKEAKRLIECESGIGFIMIDVPTTSEQADDPEARLRELWNKQGVPIERQDAIIQDATAKAQPGAHIGPFIIADDIETMKNALQEGIKVVSAPQLFPTPPEIAEKMVELAEIEPDHRILEPSAGTGNILKAIVKLCGNAPDKVAVEINPNLTRALACVGGSGLHIYEADFLECNGNLGTFDRIIMNPPFEKAVDIKHIQHALTMLKPGGRLVALCANGSRQQAAFKNEAEYWEDLPAGSFKEQGTGVNVALMVLLKER